MAFHIRNRKTEELARELARAAKLGLTEAVHAAVENELQRRKRAVPLWERTEALRLRLRKRIKNPRPVDKAFRDCLYAEREDRVR
jgi:antitoxin VapB